MTYKRLLAPPEFNRRVDVPDDLVEENLRRGFKLDPFPDDRSAMADALPASLAGGAAFCMASGPSMAAFPLEALARLCNASTCWATNNAFEVVAGQPVPRCDWLTILDRDFWELHRERLRVFLAATGAVPCLFHQPSEDVRYFQIPVAQGRTADTEPDYQVNRYWNGNSSGIAAIQMALHARPKVIFLLGHDCRVVAGKTHGSGVRNPEEAQQNYPQGKNMLPGYTVLARHAEQLGVEIYNLSPWSDVKDFPVRPIGWAAEYAESLIQPKRAT